MRRSIRHAISTTRSEIRLAIDMIRRNVFCLLTPGLLIRSCSRC